MIWKTVIILGYFISTIIATPIGIKNMQIMNDEEIYDDEEKLSSINQKRTEMALSTLNLPSNATSIRADITDGFSCENLSYGYYADIENDCQIFHVCLPVVYPDGKENTFRWSFICPEETVFSQDSFTCMRSEDMSFGCEESVKYYELNRNFGMVLDSSSETNNNNDMDMDMISEHNIREKSDLIVNDDVDAEFEEKLKPIMNKTENDYVPTISTTRTTVKPTTTVKLESNKKRRKNPNHKTQINRKISKPTTTSIPITTTAKLIVQDPEITEKLVEKPTTIKYQRFTRRPDIIKDNKKKMDLLNKVISTQQQQQQQTQKRKKPQVSLNSNSKRNDIVNIIKKDEGKPVAEKTDLLPLTVMIPTTTQLPIAVEIPIETETLKPIIIKEEPLIVDIKEHLTTQNEEEKISKNKEEETTVVTKLFQTILVTDKPLSDEIIPNMPEGEQLIAENNIITPSSNLLQQFEEENNKENESLTYTDGNIKEETENDNEQNVQKNNHDQQSMIINLISSLVNAENTKVGEEEEKFDNINVDVQNSQNNVDHLNIVSELMTTKIPVVVPEKIYEQNLNSEQVAINVEEKLKNQNDMSTPDIFNIHKHQPNHMYDQMTHIPVRIITDDLLPAQLIAQHSNNDDDQWKEVQDTHENTDKLESLNTDDKKLVMDKLEDALIDAIKMSEDEINLKENHELSESHRLENELITNNDQSIDTTDNNTNNHKKAVINSESEEIKPIYHRIIEEPENFLRSEVLSVIVDEQPIIHNINEEIITVQENELENKIPSVISNLNDISSDIKTVNNVPEQPNEMTPLDKQSINENTLTSLHINEFQVPLESLPINSITEDNKIQLSETIIDSSTAEPIVELTTLTDRTNEARSLKNKMDPRKRRFLFKSDAR